VGKKNRETVRRNAANVISFKTEYHNLLKYTKSSDGYSQNIYRESPSSQTNKSFFLGMQVDLEAKQSL